MATCHPEPASVNPLRRVGSNPARTKDDLPLPEVPTTATNDVSCNFSSSVSLRPSRPKKISFSLVLNGRNPGNGLPIMCVATALMTTPLFEDPVFALALQ